MERIIEKVDFGTYELPRLLRTVAYARVSSGKDAMLHSLSAQISAYSRMIQNHPGWLYCGVYSDEAVTGTKEDRKGFQQMLNDCRQGKVDQIIVKSISRFARNTVTLLETIRELRALNVDVFFEEQNIRTLGSEGELMITILASYAQEESLSVSENQKWRIRRNFESGIPWNGVMLGYRRDKNKYVIVPEEAEIVRRIYSEYLSGKGIEAIINGLNRDGVLTRKGFTWHKCAVARILRNSNYTGNLLLQRFYSENHITKKKCVNTGEYNMYAAADTHEAIIDTDTFNAVQVEIERRAKRYAKKTRSPGAYPFTSLIVCGKCGKNFRRKNTASGTVWICPTYNSKGKKACAAKQIPESTLELLTADVDLSGIDRIVAMDGNALLFQYRDGSSETRYWKDRSRAESWTLEMREAAGKKARERMDRNA